MDLPQLSPLRAGFRRQCAELALRRGFGLLGVLHNAATTEIEVLKSGDQNGIEHAG